jgi:hypothetical protein
VADSSTPIARAVADATNPAIVRVFNVAAFSAAGAPVIDVTSLFLTEIAELSVRGRIGARGFDQNRSFLDKVVSFPENINVEVMQTYTAPVDAGRAAGPAQVVPVMRGNSASGDVVQHGEAARTAHDAAAVRRTCRLLHAEHV